MAHSRCWTPNTHLENGGHPWRGGGHWRKRKWEDNDYPDENRIGHVNERQGGGNDHWAYAPDIVGFVCEDAKKAWFPRALKEEAVFLYTPDINRNKNWWRDIHPDKNCEKWALNDPDWKERSVEDADIWYRYDLPECPCKRFWPAGPCGQNKHWRQKTKPWSWISPRQPYQYYLWHLLHSSNHPNMSFEEALWYARKVPLRVACYTWHARAHIREKNEKKWL